MPNRCKVARWVLIAICFLPLLGGAQEVSPPDGSRILSSDGGVIFRWPGDEQQRYLLQVYAGRVLALSEEVVGTSTLVRIPPGLRYQWKVSRYARGGYLDVVSGRTFQLSDDMLLDFDGAEGAPGRELGAPGGRGQNGPNVQVVMDQKGDYVEVQIRGIPVSRKFLLPPATAPLILSVRGGRGGPGAPGIQGQDGSYDARAGYALEPRQGGDGGPGGVGGKGGDVIIQARDFPPDRYLIVRNEGGGGGSGGPAGRGGIGAAVPFGVATPRYGNEPPGNPGPEGPSGESGRILIR